MIMLLVHYIIAVPGAFTFPNLGQSMSMQKT